MAVYRLPFPAEANQSTWNVGKILAARAGVVIDLEDKWADDTLPQMARLVPAITSGSDTATGRWRPTVI